MKNENEIVMLMLSILGSFFLAVYFGPIKKIYGYKLMIISFGLFVMANIATNLERVFFENGMNLMEHLCYFGSVLLFIIWVYKYFSVKRNIYDNSFNTHDHDYN